MNSLNANYADQFPVGNIFICQRPSASAAGEGESEEEEDGGSSAGVIYKIGT